MTLLPGCRFVVAPHFHLPIDWAQRLQIGAGEDVPAGRPVPRHPWRPPTADELQLLVRAEDGATTPSELHSCVCLFQLPGHLRSGWWKLLDQGAEGLAAGQLAGFDGFARQVGEFLAFKGLAIPEGARCELVVSDPGQAVDSLVLETDRPRLWGAINLGDEPTSVVLMPGTRTGPDDAPVRLILGPGEGCRLPQDGPTPIRYLEGKQELDVLLTIRHGGQRSS